MKITLLENVDIWEWLTEIQFSKPNFQMAKNLSGKNDWRISKSKTKTKHEKKLSGPGHMLKEY